MPDNCSTNCHQFYLQRRNSKLYWKRNIFLTINITSHRPGRNNYSFPVSDATSTGEQANIQTKLKSISCELSNMRSWLSHGGETETVKPSQSTPSIHTSNLPSCSGGKCRVSQSLTPSDWESKTVRSDAPDCH